MTKILLFCFPYAGGSTAIFNKWKHYLNPAIELVPIELAGRGKRVHEALYQNVSDAVADVFGTVRAKIKSTPYALFGHSMGSLISYELAVAIKEHNFPPPVHIFFSGRSAPHIRKPKEKKYHLMGDEQFKKEIVELGGTPPEFFDHPELLEMFLPLLKSDFRIAEEDTTRAQIRPLDCNISVFFGKDDILTAEECGGWNIHTRHHCTTHFFEGGHFFLHQETERIVNFINDTLSVCYKQTKSGEPVFRMQKF